MFSDIDDVEWAAEAINALAERGIINGTGGGLFEPNNYITREEFAKIAVGCLDIDVYTVSTIKFADVDTDEWYAPYVAAINNAGYMLGYSDTEFGVGQYITREEIATIVLQGAQAQRDRGAYVQRRGYDKRLRKDAGRSTCRKRRDKRISRTASSSRRIWRRERRLRKLLYTAGI